MLLLVMLEPNTIENINMDTAIQTISETKL